MEKIIRPDLKKKYYFSRRNQTRGVATQGVLDSVGSDRFNRGVAQLVAYYVRDVGAGSSSLLTPTIKIK